MKDDSCAEMPETLTFKDYQLELTKGLPEFMQDTDPHELNGPYEEAILMNACKLFSDEDQSNTAPDMRTVYDGAIFQQGQLYLNYGDGYLDDSGQYYAKCIAIWENGVVAIECWDEETGNLHAWYTV